MAINKMGFSLNPALFVVYGKRLSTQDTFLNVHKTDKILFLLLPFNIRSGDPAALSKEKKCLRSISLENHLSSTNVNRHLSLYLPLKTKPFLGLASPSHNRSSRGSLCHFSNFCILAGLGTWHCGW